MYSLVHHNKIACVTTVRAVIFTFKYATCLTGKNDDTETGCSFENLKFFIID